jgi:hypothetical protein
MVRVKFTILAGFYQNLFGFQVQWTLSVAIV